MRVELDQADIENIDTSQPAQITLEVSDSYALIWNAQWAEDVEESEGELYYEVEDPEHRPIGRNKVPVRLSMKNCYGQNIIVPDGLVFYGKNGETGVYIPIKP